MEPTEHPKIPQPKRGYHVCASSLAWVLGISGGSCSGKTVLARSLQRKLGRKLCVLVAQDAYYRDQSAEFDGDGGSINFDHPDAIDWALLQAHIAQLRLGEAVPRPHYDFTTHKRVAQVVMLKPSPVILVDGILLLTQPAMRKLLNRSIFVDMDSQTRFERRLRRDVEGRGRNPEGVARQFYGHVEPMHAKFVEPGRAHADVVVRGDAQGIEAAIEDVLASLPADISKGQPHLI